MKLYEINEQITACIDSETGEVIDPEKLTICRSQKMKSSKILLYGTKI